MPSYKVIAPGFYQGMHYNPIGKRNVLHTDKPFRKKIIPSVLIAMPKEFTAVSEKRELQEDSVKQASDAFAELIELTEGALKDAMKAVESASDDDSKKEAKVTLSKITLELTNIKNRAIETGLIVEADKSVDDQLSEASTEGDGKETSFLGKIANAVTGNNSNVETL